MATFFSRETLPTSLAPPQRINDVAQRGKIFVLRGTIALAAQTAADNIFLGNRPAGSRFAFGMLTSSASLGASTISVGTTGNLIKYKSDAVFTAVDIPTLFGFAITMEDEPLTADEPIFLDINTASLPGAGFLIVDLYYTQQ